MSDAPVPPLGPSPKERFDRSLRRVIDSAPVNARGDVSDELAEALHALVEAHSALLQQVGDARAGEALRVGLLAGYRQAEADLVHRVRPADETVDVTEPTQDGGSSTPPVH